MRRGSAEVKINVERLLVFRDLVLEGRIYEKEAYQALGISQYLWKRWTEKYADVKLEDIKEIGVK